MLRSDWKKYTLKFKRPAGTSRGKLTTKDSWFIFIYDDSDPQIVGIGECSLLKDLSIDDREDYEEKIEEVCENINNYSFYLDNGLLEFPSIRFGLEMALMDLGLIGNRVYKGNKGNRGERILFPSDFTDGKDSIEINGLVWMGSFDFMRQQIIDKIESGFKCIKLKIGAIDFTEELSLIKSIRNKFSAKDIEIRVDANGAFPVDEALEKLKLLSEFNLHSIEQPIRHGQWEQMAELCEKSPLHIALDEELIGIVNIKEKKKLLKIIRPQYIIIKPSLVGGFKASEEWIDMAKKNNIGWWVTSALESNIGLNAIAQWTYTLGNKMPQGLGTGQLYSNNIDSGLYIENGKLLYNPDKNRDQK